MIVRTKRIKVQSTEPSVAKITRRMIAAELPHKSEHTWGDQHDWAACSTYIKPYALYWMKNGKRAAIIYFS